MSEAENFLKRGLVGVESHLGVAVKQTELDLGYRNRFTEEVEDLHPLHKLTAILSKVIEEVPKGGIIDERVGNGAADEVAVGEFGDLKGTDRKELASIVDFGVEGDELLVCLRDIFWGLEVGDFEACGGGVDEFDAGKIVRVTAFDCGKVREVFGEKLVEIWGESVRVKK